MRPFACFTIFVLVQVTLKIVCDAFVHRGLGHGRGGSKLYMRSVAYRPIANGMKEDILLFNTLSREKEIFKPMQQSKVTFYSCGPTVYDFAHIGNFRAFLTYDILKRWLQYCGYDVEHVCNLTDVDDKIMKKMEAESMTLQQVTDKYTNAFFEDLEVLNIQKAQRYPKVTEHISDIQEMIQTLIDKGSAYERNGSVYFRVSAFEDYGKLAKLKFDEVIEGAGGSGPNDRRGEGDKEDARDFVLWKGETPGTGDSSTVSWDAPFGRGRPGWHIECSAMCCKLLGPSIDIHAGGIDLVFPHHENEIAQSEAYSDQEYSKYWIHNGFVNIDNEKMSKSLKNFKTLRDIAQTPFDARAIRYMVVTSQYRNPLNFNDETLRAARKSLQRIDKLMKAMEDAAGGTSDAAGTDGGTDGAINMAEECERALSNFELAMTDDMNTPRAVAAMFGLVGAAEKRVKRGGLGSAEAAQVRDTLRAMDEVFGVFYDVPVAYFSPQEETGDTAIPEIVVEMAEQRRLAKANKQYQEADELRAKIQGAGFEIKDKKDGYELIPC